MIKAESIITQLQSVLPQYTSLFSNTDIAITSLVRTGSLITGTTNISHNLITNNYVTILNALTPIVITSLTCAAAIDGDGSIVTVVTESDHDLTEGFDFSAIINGANQTDYNGTFTVLTAPNRFTFTYRISESPVSPATGDIKFLSNNATGYNGRVKILSTPTSTTFTYATTLTPDSPAHGDAIIRSGIRVSGAISWERAQAAYTKQAPNSLWAFVVLGDNSVSKDRNVTTDAITTLSRGDAYRQRIISPFSVYIYAPCTDEISGRKVRDLMEDVRVALYKSILRADLPSVLAESQVYVVTAAGDRYVNYMDGAYYIHEFMFEVVCDVIYADTVAPAFNRAFRNFTLIEYPETPSTTIDPLTADDVNLDSNP